MKRAISARGSAKPEIHRACSLFPINLRSLHEYLFHYESEDSRSHENGHRCPSNYVDY